MYYFTLVFTTAVITAACATAVCIITALQEKNGIVVITNFIVVLYKVLYVCVHIQMLTFIVAWPSTATTTCFPAMLTVMVHTEQARISQVMNAKEGA